MDNPVMLSWIQTFVGAGCGSIVGGFISYYFARKGAKDLREEADRITNRTKLVLEWLENEQKGNPTTLTRDKEGNPTGLIVGMACHADAGFKGNGDLCNRKADDDSGTGT